MFRNACDLFQFPSSVCPPRRDAVPSPQLEQRFEQLHYGAEESQACPSARKEDKGTPPEDGGPWKVP